MQQREGELWLDWRRVAGWPDVFAMRRQAGLFGLELIRPAPRPVGGAWTLGCLTVPANPMSQATPRPSPSPCHPDPRVSSPTHREYLHPTRTKTRTRTRTDSSHAIAFTASAARRSRLWLFLSSARPRSQKRNMWKLP
jgi:hypothetical protein